MKSPLSNRLLFGLCLGLASTTAFAADENTTRPGAKTDRPTQPEYKSPSTSSQEQMSDQQFVYKAALGGQKEILLSQWALEKSQNDQVKEFARKMITDHSQVGQQLAQIAQTKGLSVPPTNAFELAVNSATPPNVGGTADSPRGSEQKQPPGSSAGSGQSGTSSGQSQGGTSSSSQSQSGSGQSQGGTPTGQRGGVYSGNSQNQQGKTGAFGTTQIPQSDLNAAKKLQDQSGSEFDTAYVSEMVKDHKQTIAKFEQASRSATDPELKQFASTTLSKLQEHNHMAEQLSQTVGAQTK